MAASNTRFTQNSLDQSKNPIDSDHGIYRDLRNVGANYPFENSRGFPGSEPNSAQGDHSRLSCSAGISSSGLPQGQPQPPTAANHTHNRSHGQTAKPQKVRPRLGARLRY